MKKTEKRKFAANLKTVSNDEKFIEQIKKIAENLYYTSETDAAVLPFVGERAEAVTAREVLRQTGKAEDTPFAETDFAKLFDRLTKLEDWFGEEEIETAAKFARLRDFLQTNLKDLRVFKIGKIELDLYALGLSKTGILAGIQTKAVET